MNIKRKFLALFIGLTLSFTVLAIDRPLLVLDAPNVAQLPKNFRSTEQSLSDIGNAEGLSPLHMFGSGQFSEKELQTVLKQYSTAKPLVIVDLRQESHGFINGDAISWMGLHNAANINKSSAEIEKNQQHSLAQISGQKIVVDKILTKNEGNILQVEPIVMEAKNVFSEETLAKQLNLSYTRFYTTDFTAPSNLQVERFLAWEKTLPKDSWVYFHCREGKGRTTTFMAMFDMMHNAKQVSFKDIMRRQEKLGGTDLLQSPKRSEIYKRPLAKERLEFLKKFYDYCKENQDNFQTTWIQWLKQGSK
ncbi:MAG: phosphatase [Proteobacteria bacterium]|nr:phosphatase [Pseudomonadota bacterium]